MTRSLLGCGVFLDSHIYWYSTIPYTRVAKMPSIATTAGVAALLNLSGALAASASNNSTALSSCTFSGSTGYSEVSENKNSCSTIILDSLEVPGGETLDLTDLNDGTTVMITYTPRSRPPRPPCYPSSGLQTDSHSGHLRGSDNLGLRRVGRIPVLCQRKQYHRKGCGRFRARRTRCTMVGWARRQRRRDQAKVLQGQSP